MGGEGRGGRGGGRCVAGFRQTQAGPRLLRGGEKLGTFKRRVDGMDLSSLCKTLSGHL